MTFATIQIRRWILLFIYIFHYYVLRFSGHFCQINIKFLIYFIS